jgi:hypothetical protein
LFSSLGLRPGDGCWPTRHSLRWPRWPKRLPFAATDFSALSMPWGRLERRWALRPSMPLCRRFCRDRATPALPSPVALSLVLSTAYLRTRALWLSWGLNFGWKASRALVFGLAVSGVSSHSPVVQGDPMGPFWLTGGGLAWTAVGLRSRAAGGAAGGFPLTRELDFRYNAPVIVPGGHSGGSGRGRPPPA